MPLHIDYKRYPTYLHATITGENNPQTFAQYTGEILKECKKQNCRRVLMEEKLEGSRMSTTNIFTMIEDASDVALGFYEALAFVNEKLGEAAYFAETVAVNRGIPIVIFDSVADAEKWLLGEMPRP